MRFVASSTLHELRINRFKGVLEEGENRGGSSGITKLMSTIIPLLIISIPIVIAFFYLRNKQHRVYAPRSFLDVLKDELVTCKSYMRIPS